MNKLYNNDCFEILPELDNESIDLVLVDPPYGTTSMEWDKILDFGKVWEELDRITTSTANMIFFGSQPFTSLLICSKLDWFKYELIWNKNKCGSPGLSKYRPNKVHENIILFSKKSGGTYNPIMEPGKPYSRKSKSPDGYGSGRNTHGYGFGNNKFMESNNDGVRYPKSILHASRNFSAQQTVHSTQKPTNLLNWLIMTYSNPNEMVLDFTMGSGSTGVAAKFTDRNFIGIEKDEDIFNIAKNRIESAQYDVVPTKHQLTTQLHTDMKTVPFEKYEAKLLKDLAKANEAMKDSKILEASAKANELMKDSRLLKNLTKANEAMKEAMKDSKLLENLTKANEAMKDSKLLERKSL